MGKTSIAYHTRRDPTGEEVTGGTFGITSPGKYFDSDTIERLIKHHGYTVEFSATGRAVFVDCKGNKVSLHIYVDPLYTSVGQKAQKAYLEKRRKEAEERARVLQIQEEELEELIDDLGHEEALRRLKGGGNG